jgi:hypothetical protein
MGVRYVHFFLGLKKQDGALFEDLGLIINPDSGQIIIKLFRNWQEDKYCEQWTNSIE